MNASLDPRENRPAIQREQGLSLVEVLIAMLLLSFIALGLLPLMQTSVQRNSEAGSYSNITNACKTTIETFQQLPFRAAALTIPPGQTQLLVTDFWDPGTRSWELAKPALPPPPTPRLPVWQRVRTLEQFSLGDLLDDETLDIPLDGDTMADFVHLKRLTIVLQQVDPVLDQPLAPLLGKVPTITIHSVKGI